MSENSNSTSRKLAAIVFTDIVGFTSLSSKNEPAAINLLKIQRDILQPIVEKHGGEWLKEIGDGLLLSFDTVKSAVDCSIEIQNSINEIENLNLRIGIHQGEVIQSGKDIIGDDVNIASRIESFSATGGIVVTNQAQSALARDPQYKTQMMGTPILKGVNQDVKIYCITSHGLPAAKLKNADAKLEPSSKKTFFQRFIFPATGFIFTVIGAFIWLIYPFISLSSAGVNKEYDKKIAVLFFQSSGSQSEQIYADGLTEEIIDRLTRVNNLSVAPKIDIIKYKNSILNIGAIYEDLNTNYIVTGSFSKINSDYKVSIELIDAERRDLLWSDNIQKKDIELFDIQDEIVVNIIDNLDLHISSENKNAIEIDPTTNLSAYDLLLKIQQESYKATSGKASSQEFLETMIVQLESVVEKDPEYADALATLGMYEFLKFFYQSYWNDPEKIDEGLALIDQSTQHSELALKYDPMNKMAHLNLPFSHLLKLWILESSSSKIFTARKAMVALNEQMNKFPEHYSTNVVKGFYHRFRCRIDILTQDNDYNDAVKYMALGIRQMDDALKENMAEPLIKILYKETLKSLATFVDTYHDYSLALEYYPTLIDANIESEMYEDACQAYERMGIVNMLIGNYENGLNTLYKGESIAKRENLYDKSLDITLTIAEIYSFQGQYDISIELLNEIENKLEANKDDGTPWLYPKFHRIRAQANYFKSQNENSLNEYNIAITKFNKLLLKVNSSYTKWIINGRIMNAMSKTVSLYMSMGDHSKSKEVVEDILEMINNEPRIYFEYSISIPYELALYYKSINNYTKYNVYLTMAYDEFNRIADLLDKKDRKYFNEISTHIQIKNEMNNI